MSDGEELSDTGAAGGRVHILQPTRDLQSNWELDLAKSLEEYLLKICSVEISDAEADHAPYSVNFAEAALLLQGSVHVYSRKVEYLYSLVLHALEFLSQLKITWIGMRVTISSKCTCMPEKRYFCACNPESKPEDMTGNLVGHEIAAELPSFDSVHVNGVAVGMPKFKRNPPVTLSKTKKKGREHKEAVAAAIKQALDSYTSAYALDSFGCMKQLLHVAGVD